MSAARLYRRHIALLGGLFVGLWCLYAMPFQNLTYDPSFYYAHIRSPVIDGDLDFANEGQPPALAAARTRTGHTPSLWSVGPALTWAPWFLLAHGATLAGRAFGLPLAPDGYNPLYLTWCALGAAFTGWLGVVCSYTLARRYAAPTPACVAAITIWLASPLFAFMYKYPLTSHAATFAAISGVLLLWLELAEGSQSLWRWFALGLAVGVAALMRWQNGLFALLIPFVLHVPQERRLRGTFAALGAASAGLLVGFAPQMGVWWRLYGEPLAMPQGGNFLVWRRPEFTALLFGSNRGLFVWHPLAIFGVVGLVWFAVRQPRLGIALLLVAALETYLNSVVRDWWGGGGYGPRRFDWFFAMEAIGVAMVFQRLWSRRALRYALGIGTGALVLAQLALTQAHYFRTLPGGVPFPIETYDAGKPLTAHFFTALFGGVWQHPQFMIAVTPTIWSSAPPPWLVVAELANGAPINTQAVASLAAVVLACVAVGGALLPARRYEP